MEHSTGRVWESPEPVEHSTRRVGESPQRVGHSTRWVERLPHSMEHFPRERRSALGLVADFTVQVGAPSLSGALDLDDPLALERCEGSVERGAGRLVSQRAAEIAREEHVRNLFEGGFEIRLDLPFPPPRALRLGGRGGWLREEAARMAPEAAAQAAPVRSPEPPRTAAPPTERRGPPPWPDTLPGASPCRSGAPRRAGGGAAGIRHGSSGDLPFQGVVPVEDLVEPASGFCRGNLPVHAQSIVGNQVQASSRAAAALFQGSES